ncbi:MAG TPA: type VI secretion system tube protein TssD [Polyangiaceae bacterium]|nr:type VI secretion system tube protein TssD [Polyangiaceae bacterium]
MAYEFYVTIEGTRQGAFKGESVREAHSSKVAGLSYAHEITSPRDIATGQASGKRQHGAITITKEWGASSPQLFQALVTNEVLKSVLFEFIHTTPDGLEEVYHTVKIVNATVSRIKQMTGAGESSNTAKTSATYDTHELEEVSFTYQRIEVENKPGQTSADDDWTK